MGGVFSPIYLPHLLSVILKGKSIKDLVRSDVESYSTRIHIKLPYYISLIFLLHNEPYFRTLFYHRLGPIYSALISWYRPGNKYFIIPVYTKIGKSPLFFHPYSTVLNADAIGDNFTCAHLTTLGIGKGGKPVIGNNVHLGANVTIIGGITVGNNVTVGAGSVVVKDIPDNAIVAGVPANIINYNEETSNN